MVADLARDCQRLLVAPERRRVVAAQARRLAEAVEEVADRAPVAQLAVGRERALLELVGLLEASERVVGHAERLRAVGAHARAGVAQGVGERERAVGQHQRGAHVAEARAGLALQVQRARKLRERGHAAAGRSRDLLGAARAL